MENDSKTTSADNWGQIIRKDARGCFVEIKNDCFHLEKVHLQFVSYDTSLPKGSRYTSNINIYIDVPEFLALTQEAASGTLHMRMQQYKQEKKQEPLYEHLGGTSAKQLAKYGKPRSDGKSLSRVVKLTISSKSDYFLTADSGPGEENKTGLIVPKFGANPEQHVSVILSWRQLNELLLTTAEHYRAWLSACPAPPANWPTLSALWKTDFTAVSASTPAEHDGNTVRQPPSKDRRIISHSTRDSARKYWRCTSSSSNLLRKSR